MKSNKAIIILKIIYLLIFFISISYIQEGLIIGAYGPLSIGHLILFSITFPIGIISYLYEPIIQYFTSFLEYLGVFSVLIEHEQINKLLSLNIFTFIIGGTGYYQWFVWFPEYLKRKKEINKP